jgi:transposase
MYLHETASEFRRRRGIESLKQGLPATLIAKVLGTTPRTLYRWSDQAASGAHVPPRIGLCPRRLTEEQLAELEQLLLKGAVFHGWPNELWTAKRVAELIERHFHVRYCANNVWKILTKRMGWSSQRPVRQASKRDDKAIQQWVAEKYPRILARAWARKAWLGFIDESGFMLGPVIRRTFAPRGHSPVIKETDPHRKISAIGALLISPCRRRFRFQFHLLDDDLNFRGPSVASFLGAVYQELASPLTLLWDDIVIHSASPVEAYLQQHPRIVAETFPHYAPELNPVDRVWGYVKFARLPNYTPPSLASLRDRITEEFRQLQSNEALLRSLFRATGLTLFP